MPRLVGCLALLVSLLGFAAAAGARTVFVIDPSRTHVGFEIAATGFPVTRGEFRSFEGRLTVDFDVPARSRVAFKVAAASLDTQSRSLDDYIKSPVFLDAAKYPTISFSSTAVEKLDERTVRVTGDMTLLGVTRPATFTVTVERRGRGGRQILGFLAKGTIHRSEFGMISGQPLVSDVVAIWVATEAQAE
ncbi:YceI family protein [Chelatococcus sp. SYSU_G07232]|uniref:YceI family protein n=1 Tax=Chelatococcus albus TaxID=3047466 RepID=A0ABT7AL62_9HYPH|nr:YceI family protein [Chelatococcus sp. SYSU_G07232]MDJ1160126.1 YceI family protein [Chelatococcus sp. SYSU_G07232]